MLLLCGLCREPRWLLCRIRKKNPPAKNEGCSNCSGRTSFKSQEEYWKAVQNRLDGLCVPVAETPQEHCHPSFWYEKRSEFCLKEEVLISRETEEWRGFFASQAAAGNTDQEQSLGSYTTTNHYVEN